MPARARREPRPPAAGPAGSLRAAAARGAGWTAIVAGISAVLQLGQIVVVARILGPREYGLAAIALILVGFAQLFVDGGISNALIARGTLSRRVLSSLYWTNIATGLLVFLLAAAAAPFVARAFDEPRLRGLLLLGSVLFLVLPIAQQFQVLLQKELAFKHIALAELTGAVAGAAAAVTGAVLGAGAAAVVIGALVNALVRTLLLLLQGARRWPPAHGFRLHDVRPFLTFGAVQLGERIVNYANSRLDQVVIAATMTTEAVAFYVFAYNLVIFPVSRINPVVTRVAFPVFARVHQDALRLKRGYCDAIRILCLTNFPILAGFAAVASDLVPMLFGERWTDAVPLIWVLVVVAALKTVGNPAGSLLLAKNRPDLGLKWNVFVLVVQPVFVGFGALRGPLGVAVAVAASQVLFTLLSYVFLVRPLLGPCALALVRAIYPATVAATVLVGAVLGTAQLASQTWHGVVVQVVAGTVAYGIACRIVLAPEERRSLKALAGGRRGHDSVL